MSPIADSVRAFSSLTGLDHAGVCPTIRRMKSRVYFSLVALAIACFAHIAVAGSAAFDLKGPSLSLTVTRNNVTLPVAQVPHLADGR